MLLLNPRPTATTHRAKQTRGATTTSCLEFSPLEVSPQSRMGATGGSPSTESPALSGSRRPALQKSRRPTSEDSDFSLVERCREELPHNLDAYNELVRRYESLVFNTCAKMIGNRADAEEVCQDAFLRVFHKLHQFEGRSSFKTWLFRIVFNMCLNRRGQLARRKDKNTQFADEVHVQAHATITDAGTEDLSEAVQEAMATLDEEKRRIVVMKFVSGLTLREIAGVLELELSATKMRLYRSLDEFKAAYLRVINRSAAA